MMGNMEVATRADGSLADKRGGVGAYCIHFWIGAESTL
jgi:hypothetical protein